MCLFVLFIFVLFIWCNIFWRVQQTLVNRRRKTPLYVTHFVCLWMDKERTHLYVTSCESMKKDTFVCDILRIDEENTFVYDIFVCLWLNEERHISMWQLVNRWSKTPCMWHLCMLINRRRKTPLCVTHICMWHVSCICDMIRSCLTWLICMHRDSYVCAMTHTYAMWFICF